MSRDFKIKCLVYQNLSTKKCEKMPNKTFGIASKKGCESLYKRKKVLKYNKEIK